METVPQEIFLTILDYIGKEKHHLKPYLTVSRRWQRVIERFFFRSLEIKNTRLSTFASLFRETEAHRKALIESLDFQVLLPAYDGDNYHQHEEVNNQVFSTAILELFQMLETFSEDENVKRNIRRGDGLRLSIRYIFSPSDSFYHLDHFAGIRGRYIKLLNHERLPILSCVSDFFSRHGHESRILDPASGILISGKLKGLQVSAKQYDDHREYIGDETRKIIRPTFTNALSLYTHSLRKFKLEMEYSDPPDEAIDPPNYVPSSSLVGPMNLAFHEFIQRTGVSIVYINGSHIISPDSFWPYDNFKPAPAPFWPKLKELCISISSATPNGEWYFMGDSKIASHSEFIGATSKNDTQVSYSNEDSENTFRSIPNPERMDPLLIAMAQAIRYAPSIKRVDLCCTNPPLSPKFIKVAGFKRQFDIHYRTSGMESPFFQVHKSRCLALYVMYKTGALIRMLRGIGWRHWVPTER
ncbi:hypothetical protein H112_03182 [Trichophyton rubrum D6]|uniref:F-box domain-containing protein n=1 Tax=Trichophyton rubrum CBS 288.86 TaxID=1215330 RepID=A0A022W6J2_TRIRU|nr:hypothetical protein H100_03186 [Trichophyton rubrum MR850]EZF43277.1 hypothetical protein H102_03180 [Trichophyton rubrum CBS 100081]EZF53919.1 hypothetical protein H103_03194 [Trichophyton rubrum CBS 288.86]EZF64567.1 hypothetical protein H104_03176 [Trichophyton rubrum CBS 289.86]EZF85846.1 hypothetical protein H110_03187 [Trichophyton rubrum MR1448]EZG18067.1 hypothetical protein H107_03291 [Trichophyton rubrum CBS 202.88]KDB35111.1 hypothetical protein H112_03182 [Trichophyton rubrum 